MHGRVSVDKTNNLAARRMTAAVAGGSDAALLDGDDAGSVRGGNLSSGPPE